MNLYYILVKPFKGDDLINFAIPAVTEVDALEKAKKYGEALNVSSIFHKMNNNW